VDYRQRGRRRRDEGFILLLCGIPVYIRMKWWQRRESTILEVPGGPEAPAEGKEVLHA
jgi:hypothetical protein